MELLRVALLVLPMLVASSAAGSVAVLVHSDDEIVLAADSIGLDKHNRALAESFCKISLHSGVAVAHTGLVEASALRWNLPVVLADRLEETRGAPIRDRIEDAMGAVTFQFGLRQQALESKPELDTMLTRTVSAVTLLFAGVDRDGAMISAKGNLKLLESGQTTGPDGSSHERQRITYQVEFCENGCSERIFVGGQERALELARRDSALSNLEGLEFANTLLEAAIAIVPERAATPVDVLRLTPDRAEWVSRKPECETAPTR